MNDFLLCYKILSNIYKEQAFSSIELNNQICNAENKEFVTKVVYGVLDKNVELDYYIEQLCKTKPQNAIIILLKIAFYTILHLQAMPDYAVVNNIVEITKSIGKGAVAGFVNATCKKLLTTKIQLPTEKIKRLSIMSSKPFWLCEEYLKQYSEEQANQLLFTEPFGLEHIRLNYLLISALEFENLMQTQNFTFIKSDFGYYVKNNQFLQQLYRQGKIAFQSYSSVKVVECLACKPNSKVLDLCSAPGGKAICIAQTYKNVDVTACDLYPHRVELINSYAQTMQVNITTMVNDATVLNEHFFNVYDYVLCDMPCSGLGIVSKKADILLNKSMEDIYNLSKLQYSILVCASKYVRDGGVLVYSTCTTLKQENLNVINKFLSKNDNFTLEKLPIKEANEGFLQLIANKGVDGFFMARLRRIK
ncbi:MAG: 16S rRNA (cytosine(967)-C(5))-methyltransferase RsmB [Clostridia bacterium]